jgi:hypothetical protein
MEESPPATHLPPEATTAKGFVGSLLDFSFESFVTPTIIRFLYALSLIGVAASTLAWVFTGGFSGFLWHLVAAPLVLLIGWVLARVYIELIMVLFKILELLRRIEAHQRSGLPKSVDS